MTPEEKLKKHGIEVGPLWKDGPLGAYRAEGPGWIEAPVGETAEIALDGTFSLELIEDLCAWIRSTLKET